MTEFLILLVLLPLDVLAQAPSPTPSSAVYPRQSQGFAAYVIGGFFGVGLLVLVMVLLNFRPKRNSPRLPDD
jgi:hypothetical protein